MTPKLTSAPTLGRRHNQVETGTTRGHRDRQRRQKRFKQDRKNAVASLYVKELMVLKSVNDLFTDAVDYRQYRLFKSPGDKKKMWLMICVV